MAEKDDNIELSSMSQRELIRHTYQEVQTINQALKNNAHKQNQLEERIRIVENKQSEERGRIQALAIIATIGSVVSVLMQIL